MHYFYEPMLFLHVFLGLFQFLGKVIVHQVRHDVDHLMQVLQLIFLHSLGVILLMPLVLQFY